MPENFYDMAIPEGLAAIFIIFIKKQQRRNRYTLTHTHGEKKLTVRALNCVQVVHIYDIWSILRKQLRSFGQYT